MHNGHWNDDWGGGGWWWMFLMMIVFWGGLIWLAVILIRRDHHPRPQAPEVTNPPRATPQEILAERLARGEIEPEDYRQRLDALRHRQDG